MKRSEFKEEMETRLASLKELFLMEYFSDAGCMEKKEEDKILQSIRKIQQIVEAM